VKRRTGEERHDHRTRGRDDRGREQVDAPYYHGPRRIWQGGQRRLWTENERAHQIWTELGRPQHEDVGMTVTPDRQWIWLAGQGLDWNEDLMPV
jgi:hypothetical protein